MDTKLYVFLLTLIFGAPPGRHPRRPQIENQKSGSDRQWGLVSCIIMSSFVAIHPDPSRIEKVFSNMSQQ